MGWESMPIEQVTYVIPDDVWAGLLSGQLSRFGSVVRDQTQIIAHLKEVRVPDDQEASATLLAAALGTARVNRNLLIGLGVVVVAVGGTGLALAVRKTRTRSARLDAATVVGHYNASLSAYLEAVQAGSLDTATLGRLVADLDALKQASDDGKVTIELSPEQSETLVHLVVDYTQLLAQANSVRLSDVLEQVPDAESNTLADLRRHLEAQRRIFADAA